MVTGSPKRPLLMLTDTINEIKQSNKFPTTPPSHFSTSQEPQRYQVVHSDD